MKALSSLVVLVAFGVALSARAEADKHPCVAIKKACQAAGFYKGGHKQGKGLWKDCVDPILAGQTVAGVTLNAADIGACQAKKATFKK